MAEQIHQEDIRVLLAKERTDLALGRNRLANERTFLAWIRTGLACVGGGVAIVRLISFHTETHQTLAHIIGQILIFTGIALFIFSVFNYRSDLTTVPRGKKTPAPLLMAIFLAAILVTISILLMFIT